MARLSVHSAGILSQTISTKSSRSVRLWWWKMPSTCAISCAMIPNWSCLFLVYVSITYVRTTVTNWNFLFIHCSNTSNITWTTGAFGELDSRWNCTVYFERQTSMTLPKVDSIKNQGSACVVNRGIDVIRDGRIFRPTGSWTWIRLTLSSFVIELVSLFSVQHNITLKYYFGFYHWKTNSHQTKIVPNRGWCRQWYQRALHHLLVFLLGFSEEYWFLGWKTNVQIITFAFDEAVVETFFWWTVLRKAPSLDRTFSIFWICSSPPTFTAFFKNAWRF